jgi:hypothetical protein
MNTAIIVILIAVVIVAAWQKIKFRGPASPVNDAPGNLIAASQIVNATEKQSIDLPEDVWWKALDGIDQLHLALHLARKALPVWEKFTSAQHIIYRNSSTGPVNKIDSRLLQSAIEEMQLHSRLHFPAIDDKEINQYYNSFVNPVIALQDGAWSAPYPVKKIFLSVYNILKSILEQNSVPGSKNYLATAINQSIDCIEVSKLYSRDEIAVFLESFKNRL